MKTSFLSLLLAGTALVHGQSEWPEWRGPNGNGAYSDGKIPMKFSEKGKELVWKAALPGRGCSTPIVKNGLLFLTAPIDGKDSLLAFDLDGKEKWKVSYAEETPGRGQKVGSGANSSCVSDGKVVVGYFKSGRVVGVNHEGKKLWEYDLHKKYGEDKLWWDQGTSPVLAAGNAVIAVMQTEGNSYLVSIDLQSGDIAWKTDRNIKTQRESGDSYTTPHVVKVDGVETIISFGADHITGHDAKSGKLVWTSAGVNPDNKGMWRTIASSVYTDGVVVVPHGRGDFLMGLKAGGQGDVTKSNVLWRKKYSCTDAATPVAHDGKVYLLIDRGKNRGVINCIDAKSGKELWSGRLPKSASTYYASPIMIGDTFCVPREDGTVVMAKIKKDGLGEVVENKLGQSFIASPIAVDGKLILRGDTFLWCVK